ncbi:MAG: AAA family ATPase [Candidatus Diapherotrites archaeon]|nr:AAA family ATPase [Candidatus Diapherotrites archaeon]
MWDYEPKIIKDEKPLLEAFVPEHVLHREGQKQLLVSALKPALAGRRAVDSFFYGPCGTGKTLLARWLLNELESHSSKVQTVYVNCWKNNTAYTCLSSILKELGVFTTYRQATSELLKQLEVEAREKATVVCLDEVDSLEDKELLYSMSRSGVALLLISNDPYALVDLDLRIKSSLRPEPVEFPAYKTVEIFDILMQRRSYAFVPGTVDDIVLKLVARLSDGDARVALETLRRAALLSEERGEDKVTSTSVKEVFKTTGNLRKSEALKRLNEHEKALYQIIEGKKKISTKRLFEEYTKIVENPATDRTYRNYMNHLVKLGLVKATGELTGRKYELV